MQLQKLSKFEVVLAKFKVVLRVLSDFLPLCCSTTTFLILSPKNPGFSNDAMQIDFSLAGGDNEFGDLTPSKWQDISWDIGDLFSLETDPETENFSVSFRLS